MVERTLIEKLKHESAEDRIAVIGELWDSLDERDLPVDADTATLIAERETESAANPGVGYSLDEVVASLRERRSA